MIIPAYLEYLDSKYKEAYDYLQKKYIAVDYNRLNMYFDKIVIPYKYWLEEYRASELVKKDFDREGFLNGLKKKYKMIPTKTGLKLPGYLNDRGEFKHLADNMRLCGYEYNKEDQEFQLMEVPNHV